MINLNLYEFADMVTDTTNLVFDKLVDKVCEVHEQSREMVAKAVAYVLVKTVLKDYMFNMQMYELKHWEEDIPVNERN